MANRPAGHINRYLPIFLRGGGGGGSDGGEIGARPAVVGCSLGRCRIDAQSRRRYVAFRRAVVAGCGVVVCCCCGGWVEWADGCASSVGVALFCIPRNQLTPSFSAPLVARQLAGCLQDCGAYLLVVSLVCLCCLLPYSLYLVRVDERAEERLSGVSCQMCHCGFVWPAD
ncbi:hypothetical protein IWZ00DRAFT_260160 [Phyllosticta capitalensis]